MNSKFYLNQPPHSNTFLLMEMVAGMVLTGLKVDTNMIVGFVIKTKVFPITLKHSFPGLSQFTVSKNIKLFIVDANCLTLFSAKKC
jgi:hypothetical protein